MKQNDSDWFKPLWRRVAVTAFIVIWLGYEVFFSHDTTWMMIVGFALAYAVWSLFINFDKRGKGPGAGPDDTGAGPGGSDDAKPEA